MNLKSLIKMPIKDMTDTLVENFGDTLIPEEEGLSDMAYWFPILETIGMRVPKTILVHRGGCELSHLLDEKKPDNYDRFERALFDAMDEIGYPCFFRTGHISNKFEWERSCFIKSKPTGSQLLGRVTNLVEISYMANIAGRPFNYDFWAVREMIPTKPVVHHFRNMPIAMEVRAFIKDGKVQCIHPYWVEDSFKDAPDEVKLEAMKLQIIPKDAEEELMQMLAYIADHFNGYWSVDMLRDVDGNWWCTDMGTGDRSYHLPSCKHAKKK
jgi:hypothetical protein